MSLQERLKKVSENNVAFIEVYGAMPRWRLKLKEVSELPESELLIEVEKLEAALEAVKQKEEQAKLDKENKKAEALKKLEKLGLTQEDFKALMN